MLLVQLLIGLRFGLLLGAGFHKDAALLLRRGKIDPDDPAAASVQDILQLVATSHAKPAALPRRGRWQTLPPLLQQQQRPRRSRCFRSRSGCLRCGSFCGRGGGCESDEGQMKPGSNVGACPTRGSVEFPATAIRKIVLVDTSSTSTKSERWHQYDVQPFELYDKAFLAFLSSSFLLKAQE